MEVILTHEHADCDALASLLAASKLYPEATPVLPHTLNRNLRDFLVLYRGALPFRRAEELPRQPVELAYFVDTQKAQSIRGMTAETRVRIIDHHTRERELPPHYHYWGEPVGATTTLLVEQIMGRGVSLSGVEATLLALGIYEDTGSLSYASTTARDIRCAAWLLEKGANLEIVREFLYHPLTPSQQRLLKQLDDHVEMLEIAGHVIALTDATTDEAVEEISTLAHKLRDRYDTMGLFLIVDLGDRIQMVARSTTAAIDVGAIAKELGGGGHARAAAALIRGQTLAGVRRRLLELLHSHVREPVTVRQIMSWNVHTFTPDTTIGEASERMARLGHEGFPLVQEGRLIGLVTRRELDRAVHHKLHKSPISRIMRQGEFTVHTDDSILVLRKRMMESGWGQMPVVDDAGKMVGVVTRTDLLKLWAAPAEETPPSVALKMERALSPQLVQLLRSAGEMAAGLELPLFAVGGFARDLLLGAANADVDLVVEGDATQLAEALAARFGGRVRSHRRFGTAKWIRDEAAFAAGRPLADETPASLDFAAARIEFYEEATALPVIERSSIKLDLHRRDFTINTLAIRLDGAHWGQLLDFYSGRQDLEAGLIRVLHSLSFIEDPTRILRAVRFEQRFDFRLEERTAELIDDASDLLERVSPARLRHEFDLILQEREPERALKRLHELRVLAAIDPGFTWSEVLARRFRELRRAVAARGDLPTAIERLYFCVWLFDRSRPEQERLGDRLRVSALTRSLLAECQGLAQLLPELKQTDLLPSQIDRRLSPYSAAALLAAAVANEDARVRERIRFFETTLRPRQITLTGDDLRAMGAPPGPLYRRILGEVRATLLDGHIHTAAEEIALAQDLLRQSLPA